MKSDNCHRLIFLTSLLLIVVAPRPAPAQSASTDRDNPTPLTANEVRGTGINRAVQYYYTFLAGPGEVVLTTDAQAKSGSTFFEVEVFNLDAESIDVIRYGPTMTPERKVKRFSIAQQMPVLLRINLDSSAGNYLVRVGGAVQLDSATTLSPTPVPADASGTTPVISASDPAVSIPATTEGSPPGTTSETSSVVRSPRFQKLWMRLGAASELLGLSTTGKLRIDMKDGTSQEFGLLNVKKIFTPKGADSSSPEPGNEGWQRLWMKLGTAGELGNLASTGSMRLELRDGTTQEFDLAKIKKVSLKK